MPKVKKKNTCNLSEIEEWLVGRPPLIKSMVRKWPPAIYIVKRGAPYGVAVYGTLVTIYSYNEDGTIGVIVKAKDKKQTALDHEEYLVLKYHKGQEFLKEMHKKNILVNIDPTWLGEKVPTK